MTARLFLVQRLTASILAPLVLVHLGVIVYAMRNGLSAGEILDRTRGSLGWAAFYGGFVLTVSAHGAVGLRTLLIEWGGQGQRSAAWTAVAAGLLLLVLGLRAVWAVIGGGAP